ncbi:MAG: AlkZ family DNA glycosylase [Fimbriimonas ginsengisoli]|uniref:AlkZ family DNA glycosylase n=1 Tax=Fimbriimonas ginsengisoli TaxID=1005039 RepID=A0A931LWD4_FIMGI|nr:AlkZ family DNA glycosylase [Fimbriimonas ginsengisoli]
MSEPVVITAAQARAWILTKQGLAGPAVSRPNDVVGRVFAVQTQYASSLPVAVAARGATIRPNWDCRALARGEIVKTWSVRSTLHAHLPDDYALMLEALGAAKRENFLRWMHGQNGLGRAEVERLEGHMLDALERGPLTREALHARVPEFREFEMTGWGGDVMGLAYQGRLRLLTPVRGPTLFQRCEPPAQTRDVFSARVELLRRYLLAYGPATLADFLYWSGLKAGETTRVLATLAPELREVQVEGLRGTRWVVASDEPPNDRARFSSRLLAKFDPLVMSYRDRRLFLSDSAAPKVFRKAGQVEATVLQRGRLVATWRLEKAGAKGATIRISPLRAGGRLDIAALAPAAQRLGKTLGLASVTLNLARTG